MTKRANVLDKNEFKRLLKIVSASTFSKRDTLLVLMSFGLGLRVVELAALKIDQVIDEDGKVKETVNLIRTKDDKKRTVYIADDRIKKAIIEYIKERKIFAEKKRLVFSYNHPLFLSRKNVAFTNKTLAKRFENIYKDAGFKGASSHSGRRTFATNLIEKGIDIKAVSTLMGHSHISMTAQYVQDNPVRLKKICSEALY